MINKEQIEKKLNDLGLGFTFCDSIDINSIDIKKSLHNQARISEKINTNVVSIYENDLKNGDMFPPIIIEDRFKNGNGMIVIDGNHRIVASRNIKNSHWVFGAYILDPLTSMQFRILTSEVNLKHGLPASFSDRIEHAIYLVDNGGIKRIEAAKRMGVSESALGTAFLWIRIAERIGKVNLSVPEIERSILKTSIVSINSINDDDVFKACLLYTLKTKQIATEEVRGLIRILKKMNTAREQLEYIEKELSNNEKVKKAMGGIDINATNFLKKINTCFNNISNIASINIESIPQEVEKDFIKKVDKCLLALADIKKRFA